MIELCGGSLEAALDRFLADEGQCRVMAPPKSEDKLSDGPASIGAGPLDGAPVHTAAGGPKEWVVAAGPVGGASSNAEMVTWFKQCCQFGLLTALAEPDNGAQTAIRRRFGWG